MAALEAVGIRVRHLPPASIPFPTGPRRDRGLTSTNSNAVRVIVDRCQNRDIGSNLSILHRASGAYMIDAGLAASGSRVDIALALDAEGIPRPDSRFVIPGDSGIQVVEEIGYPATFFPVKPGSKSLPVSDFDIAEALLEHRETLGTSEHGVLLIQAGVVSESALFDLLVVDGSVVAIAGTEHVPDKIPALAQDIAVETCRTIGARFASVQVVDLHGKMVVFDVAPVPEFRDFAPLGSESVAESIASAAIRTSEEAPVTRTSPRIQIHSLDAQAVRDGVVYSA